MLTLYHNGQQLPIQDTEYYVRELASGLDEVIFNLSIYDPIYAALQEEEQITDRGGQRYLVKQIDAGANSAKVICQIDLDAWKADMYEEYTNGSATVYSTIDGIKPTGWTVLDRAGINIRRTIKGAYTPLQICEVCRDTYKVYLRWDTLARTCTIFPMSLRAPAGSFATRELNLKEINYKGKSTDFITRLYAFGAKDDAGKPMSLMNQRIGGQVYPYKYVDNFSYSNKIICGYWIDERYTDPASLYDDAVAKLAVMAQPSRSYSCSVVDLQATNPEVYNNLDFSLFTTVTLIDDIKETAVNYQVVERHAYPYHPELNEIMLDSAPARITSQIVRIADSIENPSSAFQQILDIRAQQATNWLLSGDGYVVAVQDEDGSWKELLFLDTPDISTAQKVLRINENGIGFSTTGANGPYTNAWTIDGQLVADFITTGTLTANVMRAGTIRDLAGKNWWNLDTGEIQISAEAVVDTSEFVTQAQFTAAADRIASEVVEQVGSGIFYNVVPTDNGNGTVTLQAHVYLNRNDATQTFSQYFFQWYKKTEDSKDFIGYGYEITVTKTEYGYGGEVEGTFLMLEDRYPVNSQGRWVFTQNGSYFTLATSQGELLFAQGHPMVLSEAQTSGNVYPVFGYDYYE